MQNKLKIGVIGTGHMGENHVRNISEESRFDFIGIYDNNPNQAKRISEKYSVDYYSDLDELLKNVEAIVIAVPSSLHKDLAIKAADFGVHALVEKPLATNSQDAQYISDYFKNKNLKLAVGHIERFNPVFKELLKLVSNEEIFFIDICRFSPFSSSGRITDTSVVEDLMIHDIDLVLKLMKKSPTEIIGKGRSIKTPRTDFATCIMDFNGVCHATIKASRVSQTKERYIIIHTPDKLINADLLSKTITVYKSVILNKDDQPSSGYKQDVSVENIYVPIIEPLRSELIAFYDAIISDSEIEADGNVGVNAIKICEQVINSIK